MCARVCFCAKKGEILIGPDGARKAARSVGWKVPGGENSSRIEGFASFFSSVDFSGKSGKIFFAETDREILLAVGVGRLVINEVVLGREFCARERRHDTPYARNNWEFGYQWGLLGKCGIRVVFWWVRRGPVKTSRYFDQSAGRLYGCKLDRMYRRISF